VNPDCSTCGGPLQPVTHPAVEHQEGPVRASAEPRQGQGCARGCSAGVTAATEGAEGAVDRALRDRLVIASRGRWPRAKDRCGDCGVTLDLPLRATTRALTVEPSGGAPFTITLAVPLGRCPACGCDNVPSALAGAVRRAACIAAGTPGP